MKKKLLLFAFIFFTATLFSQDYPDCTHLKVENIAVNNESGFVDIEISNSCTDCRSGIDGCVYAEMKIYRTVEPFDVIAESGCWCLFAPENGGSVTFMLDDLTHAPLPPASDLRVWFNCGVSGFCDAVPFSATMTTGKNIEKGMVSIYPNPSDGFITVALPDNMAGVSVKISDVTGKSVFNRKINAGNGKIDISGLANGIYIASISDENSGLLKTLKFIKE